MLDPQNYDYQLPPSLISNAPTEPRDHCRLLTLDRKTGGVDHHHFYDLANLLKPSDVLVLNQTKVFPARLFGQKSTGGQVELLLLEPTGSATWRSIAKPGLKKNTIIKFDQNLSGKILEFYPETGEVDIEFNQKYLDILDTLDQIGHTPIPPYIHPVQAELDLRSSYQTIYAKTLGSAAAPTAGLHFTAKLIDQIKMKGIDVKYITLHVGLGTFQPLRPQNIESKKLHHEPYSIDPAAADFLLSAKKSHRRLIAVGTTTARTLEAFAVTGKLSGSTDLFIYPPYQFHMVDSLITNFHLPKSSLLMLITAFAGYDRFVDSPLATAYQQAIDHGYGFFSFGDAMWLF